MKAAVASAILTFLLLLPAQGKARHCMLRIHAEANPQDTEVFASSIRAQISGKPVSIEKMASISERDVIGFHPYPLGNGNYGVLFELNDHGRLTLDTLSVEHRGGYLFIFINGRAITEMQIDKRVSDGKLYISSGITEADIQLMKKDWRILGEGRRR
jgi:hypothetical protein